MPFSASRGLPGGSVVKNPPANAGDAGSIPESGRAPGGGNTTPSSILAWEDPWTEVSVRLLSMKSQRVGHDLRVLYICVSFAVLHIGSSLPSF